MISRLWRKFLFTKIFRTNFWKGESRSGTGSDFSQTAHIIAELPTLLNKYGIKSLLDVPCGDFHWMSKVNLNGIKYHGGDIVTELVIQNQRKFGNETRAFSQIDLISDKLPVTDAIFVRDCLVHMPYRSIFEVLKNIKKSRIKFLITTTFTERTKNDDIKMGDWRCLNLQIAPFNLPAPLAILNERCTELNMQFTDKSLGFWLVESLPNF